MAEIRGKSSCSTMASTKNGACFRIYRTLCGSQYVLSVRAGQYVASSIQMARRGDARELYMCRQPAENAHLAENVHLAENAQLAERAQLAEKPPSTEINWPVT